VETGRLRRCGSNLDRMTETARVATPADIDAIVAVLTTAFSGDPLWGPVFQHRGPAAPMWRIFATSALRYPWTLVTPGVESAAIWIPPGGAELTDDEVDRVRQELTDGAGAAVAKEVMEIFDLFEAARPGDPHCYLSLLGTHDDHRGKGLGMGLLAESLVRIDELGVPAYLESSNPANNLRYERLGFAARDRITAPSGHIVTTMWRTAQSH